MVRKGPVCSCGKPKVNGRCTAFPSCDDIRDLRKEARRERAKMRREAKEAVRIGLGPKDFLEKVKKPCA